MENKEVNVEEVKLADVEAAVETDNNSLQNELDQLNDKYLRLAAELENTRRRSALDCENAARNRGMSIASNFLPVMDAIDAALTHDPKNEGIQSMARALESAFAKTGVVRIESVGQTLNPQFHNAIQVVETPDTPTNTIVSELQTGYMFGDMVLRPAMVVVAK